MLIIAQLVMHCALIPDPPGRLPSPLQGLHIVRQLPETSGTITIAPDESIARIPIIFHFQPSITNSKFQNGLLRRLRGSRTNNPAVTRTVTKASGQKLISGSPSGAWKM